MASKKSKPRYQLLYWPLPFRGCFVSYLFAFRNVPLLQVDEYDTVAAVKNQEPGDQDVPFMGPPVLRDFESGRSLSQMPAIVLGVSGELGLRPDDPFDLAMSMKILMDCNDVLMEICRYNGASIWARDEWTAFRSERLPRWLDIFEESLNRGYLGGDPATFADIAVYALFGNMTRCLPELEPDVANRAPGIHALCRTIGSERSLAAFVHDEERRYGKVYCGGQIEKSIRKMLELDADTYAALP